MDRWDKRDERVDEDRIRNILRNERFTRARANAIMEEFGISFRRLKALVKEVRGK